MNNSNHSRTLHPELAPGFTEAVTVISGGSPTTGLAAHNDLSISLLNDAYDLGCSDIHIEPHRDGSCIRLRLDGTVQDVAHVPIVLNKILVNQFKALANLDPITRFTPRDAHAKVNCRHGTMDIRLALAPALDRESLAIRLLDPKRLERSINELGLSSETTTRLAQWLEDINGMFLTTGPTGSGKTTTLYALLHALKRLDKVILSLEDPVEYQINGIGQIQIDELHEFQFGQGIRALLRHDADYLMVGEIRDAASAVAAAQAAISGRVLLSTMHSRDCVGAICGLRNWGLADHEIGEALSVVVAQRLVRKVCVHCGERRPMNKTELSWFESLHLPPPQRIWEGRGCSACRNLGFKGRTGVFELWRLDESDYKMILRHVDEHQLRGYLAEKGHRFLLNEALDLLDQGVTTLSEVHRVAAGTVPPPGSPGPVPNGQVATEANRAALACF